MTEFLQHDPTLGLCVMLALMLPLLSGVISLSISERYSWLTILNAPFVMLAAAGAGIVAAILSWNESQVVTIPWIQLNGITISANMKIENYALLMMATVGLISFLIHLYSVGYMAGDAGVKKYFGMLGFFTFAMQGIVLADNLLVLFFFWELVGFSSFMLIGHYSEEMESGAAARKAFLFNRVGDAGFLIGIMVLWNATGTLEITSLLSNVSSAQLTIASLLIFCGVTAKSAQFPLFGWLPDAMVGPTPVSALIHAATMVAAGVYLLVRVFPIFTSEALTVVAYVGALTAVASAVSAMFQHDIKKVLAYSTLSQLGLMITAVGMGAVDAAFLHLITHAFFKAGLFLGAGSVIHSLQLAQARMHQGVDPQHLANMGGLRKRMPITFVCFLISACALSGIPFFSGFISKEAMLSVVMQIGSSHARFIIVVMMIVSFLTVLYTFRLVWLVFMGEPRTGSAEQAQEAPPIMRAPALLLAGGSLWIAFSWNPIGSASWIIPKSETAPLWFTLVSVAWVAVGTGAAYFLFRKSKTNERKIFSEGFFVDRLYDNTIGKGTSLLAVTSDRFDRSVIDGIVHASAYAHVTLAHVTGWFDRFIVDGVVRVLASMARFIGSIARSFQSGKVQDYIFWAVLAIIIFIIWMLNT